MAGPFACNQKSEAQTDDYIQSRLKQLSPTRFYIGINSSSIWGKENPVEEKRHLEEVCRGAESKLSTRQKKTPYGNRIWQFRRNAFNQRQLPLTDRTASAKPEGNTRGSNEVRHSGQSVHSDRPLLWRAPSTSTSKSSWLKSSTTAGHVGGTQPVSVPRNRKSMRI